MVTERVRQEQIQVRSLLASSLPDCRAYEQVSPIDKNTVDASGEPGRVQASLTGEEITFFALAPFPETEGAGQLPSYLSIRSLSGDEWSTQGLEALAPAGSVESVAGVTENLGKTIVKVGSGQAVPSCEPTLMVCGGLNKFNYYVRNNTTGTFQFIAEVGNSVLGFADATPTGSQLLFETEAKLTSEANPGVNLYEWDETKPPTERISLAGVLPGDTAPKEGSYAGPGGPATNRVPPLENKWHFYTQNAISGNGSRVFFSDAETGDIYMREPQAAPAVTIPISKGEAFWRAATPDGSYVIYSEGEELYRFNVNRFEESEESEVKALAEAREQLTTGAEGVLGILGGSGANASYVYFVAPGELAFNENDNKEIAVKGAANLYEWHEGALTFVARLVTRESVFPQDEADWRGWTDEANEGQGPSGGEQSSRTSSDGRYLLFSSVARLTQYNNNGFTEFYLYDAGHPLSSNNPVCVSCNPTRTVATASVHLTNRNLGLVAAPAIRNAFLEHNLSSDGRRVFFETEEALVPGDANLQSDVYEWEAGGGSCKDTAQNGGCLYLISSGQSTQRSYFGDASANGDNVFFFTRQSLVSQDQDDNVDLYDARVEGGIPSQNPLSPSADCAQEAACRGESSNTPSVFGTPSSTTFSEVGNLAPPPPLPLTRHVETRAKKLLKALKACRSKPRSKRRRCEAAARKRYGTRRTRAKGSTGGSRR
jgi:hypothetical protein